jgi:hypothetical protein
MQQTTILASIIKIGQMSFMKQANYLYKGDKVNNGFDIIKDNTAVKTIIKCINYLLVKVSH